MKKNYVLKLWKRCGWLPGGKRLFTRMVTSRARYFRSFSPKVVEVKPNHVAVSFKKKPAVQNHIGTVHVIATCNAMEMAMGIMAEASIPAHLRWIPKGMEVDYQTKGETDITAVARIDADKWQPGDVYVDVVAKDTQDRTVVAGKIKLWITEKPQKKAA